MKGNLGMDRPVRRVGRGWGGLLYELEGDQVCKMSFGDLACSCCRERGGGTGWVFLLGVGENAGEKGASSAS